eukprot:IDg9296t1
MGLMSIFQDSEDGSRREPALVSSALLAGAVLGYLARPLLMHLGLGRIAFDESDGAVSDEDTEADVSGEASTEETKMVFCVRSDLKMKKGKIAAQVGHATLGAYKNARRSHPALVRGWEGNAQPKIALQIPSAHAANQLEAHARRIGLPTYKVFDAGRTQIAAVRVLFYFSNALRQAPLRKLTLLLLLSCDALLRPLCLSRAIGKYDCLGDWSSTQVEN